MFGLPQRTVPRIEQTSDKKKGLAETKDELV